ncbi:DUF2513 domain-containing protein [Paenibacillus illinoisensis]|uniref:DUF2513 domain-containing protein n=1 Tax=Paenibacillus illinoisensis TaxID=59845 RepID=UPI00301CAF33
MIEDKTNILKGTGAKHLKRDMELIIDILKCIEETKTSASSAIVVHMYRYDTKEKQEHVQYQINLLKDAGYVEARGGLNPYEFTIYNMTWAGHDFLDAARNEVVVSKTKEFVKSKGLDFLSLPIDVAKELLVETTKKMLFS